jgi:hypothetical protein
VRAPRGVVVVSSTVCWKVGRSWNSNAGSGIPLTLTKQVHLVAAGLRFACAGAVAVELGRAFRERFEQRVFKRLAARFKRAAATVDA